MYLQWKRVSYLKRAIRRTISVHYDNESSKGTVLYTWLLSTWKRNKKQWSASIRSRYKFIWPQQQNRVQKRDAHSINSAYQSLSVYMTLLRWSLYLMRWLEYLEMLFHRKYILTNPPRGLIIINMWKSFFSFFNPIYFSLNHSSNH